MLRGHNPHRIKSVTTRSLIKGCSPKGWKRGLKEDACGNGGRMDLVTNLFKRVLIRRA